MAAAVMGAAATDRFYIEDFTIAPGETMEVSILLENEIAYSAFQSDIYLPEGLTATKFALTNRKNSNHILTATALPDGGIRLLSYSLKLKTYSGNSGSLASDEFAGNASIRLQETVFTTAEGVEVTFEDETCDVSLPTTGLKGDVNKDGYITITDVTALIDYLLSGDDSAISLDNADFNLDHSVSIIDVTALIDYLLTNS